MSHGHKHTDGTEGPHHGGDGRHNPSRKKWHRDWRVIAVAILMLVAMLIYVLTLNDSVWPGSRSIKGNRPAEQVPAALP